MRLDFARRLTFAGLALGLLAAIPASPRAEAAKKPTYASGQVYLIRGLGDFWSRGMDKFKVELDALGVPNTILNHLRWPDLAKQIIARYRTDKSILPIVIIGHSYGADAGVILSNWLGQNGIPVRLLVAFDNRNKIPPVGDTVAEVIDYYKPPFGRPTLIPPGFAGPVTVTNLAGRADITHDSIDKKDEYHRAVIAKILAILKKKKPGAKG